MAVTNEELERRVVNIEDTMKIHDEDDKNIKRILQHEIHNGDIALRNFEITINEKMNLLNNDINKKIDDSTKPLDEKIDKFIKNAYKNILAVIVSAVLSLLINVGMGFYWAGQMKQTTIALDDKIDSMDERIDRLEDRLL